MTPEAAYEAIRSILATANFLNYQQSVERIQGILGQTAVPPGDPYSAVINQLKGATDQQANILNSGTIVQTLNSIVNSGPAPGAGYGPEYPGGYPGGYVPGGVPGWGGWGRGGWGRGGWRPGPFGRLARIGRALNRLGGKPPR